MTRYAAFLRGVNLGKRTVKSADLKTVFEALGFAEVKTLLASGNVLFDSPPDKNLQKKMEAALRQQFGFEVGTVLRSLDELGTMVESQPFGKLRESADIKLYVLLFAEPLPKDLRLTGQPGDFDMVGQTQRELFVVAHRQPNGRYGEGMLKLEKQLPKGTLVTTRNWNTILRAVATS